MKTLSLAGVKGLDSDTYQAFKSLGKEVDPTAELFTYDDGVLAFNDPEGPKLVYGESGWITAT